MSGVAVGRRSMTRDDIRPLLGHDVRYIDCHGVPQTRPARDGIDNISKEHPYDAAPVIKLMSQLRTELGG